MQPGDTDIGGPNRGFKTTIWSDVLAAGDPSNPASREPIDRLIRSYWKPVYACIRASWNTSTEDAKDYTQAFFARLIEKETWSRIQQERGSFRSYLKAALKYFMINAREGESVRKPVDGAFSLDIIPFDVAAAPTPDKIYDREWFKCVLDESIAELSRQLLAEKKAKYFEVFKSYCLDRSTLFAEETGSASYQEVAGRLGLHHSDVRNYLSYCRKAIRRIVRERIRDYVASDEEADREMKEAFGTS